MILPAESNGHQPGADGAVAAYVMHASPGRLRVRVERAFWDDPRLRDAEQALAEIGGVVAVQRKPAARSILVCYDPDRAILPLMFAAVTRAGVKVQVPDSAPRAKVTRPTRSNAAVSSTIRRADRWVAEQTRGRADLRTLVPLSLAALALREVLSGRAVAVPWYALAWYAFDSFHKFDGPDEGNAE